jgi:hypothetical protein
MVATADPFDPDAAPQLAGVDIPGTDWTIPTPGDVLAGAADSIVGQTTQTLFSAVLGPVAELTISGILAGGAVALIVIALTTAARRSKTVQQAIGIGSAVATGGASAVAGGASAAAGVAAG